MGHSQAAKAESRKRIVSEASRRIRESGLEGFSIAELMESAGLTHGAFYSHFESRDDLMAAALAAALKESKVVWGEPDPRRTVERVVGAYLDPQHRDAPQTGCAIAALSAEVARTDDKARDVMDDHLQRYIAAMEAMLETSGRPDLAVPILSAQLGALMVARALKDEALSNRVLDETRAFILSLTAEPKSQPQS